MKKVLEKATDNVLITCHLDDEEIKLFLDLVWSEKFKAGTKVPKPPAAPSSVPEEQAKETENEIDQTGKETDLGQVEDKPGNNTDQSQVEDKPKEKVEEKIEKESPNKTVRPTADILLVEIKKALSEIIKVNRLDDRVIAHAIEHLLEDREVKQRRVAKGKLPEPPRDGRLVFMVKKISKQPDLVEDQKGTVDLRSLRLFDNIQKQQVVARVYPPAKGNDGEDAFGNRLESQMGKEITFKIDKSLQLEGPKREKNYSTIISLEEGYLSQTGETLAVNNVLEIGGDIDYGTGNVDFIGSVIVSGAVLPGFTVKARKDIIVRGVLDGGRLISTDGSVQVEKLVAATSPSYVEAAKDVELSVVQGATIKCAGTLKIKKEARNCNLYSFSIIDMQEAELIGGSAFAICGIQAKVIGNESNVATRLSLCSDIEMDAKFRKLVVDIEKHETALNVLKSHLGPYANNPTRVLILKGALKDKMIAMLEQFTRVSKSYGHLLNKRDSMLEGAKTSSTVAISVSDVVHPGVEISAPGANYFVKDPIKGPKSITYDEEKGEFSVSDYKEVVCTFRDSKTSMQEKKDNE